jgi:hypothetical protein
MIKERIKGFVEKEKQELKTAKWKTLVASALIGLTIVGGVASASYGVDGFLLSALHKQDKGFIALANDMVNQTPAQVATVIVYSSLAAYYGLQLYSSKKNYMKKQDQDVGNSEQVIFDLGDGGRLVIPEGMQVDFREPDGSNLTISAISV